MLLGGLTAARLPPDPMGHRLQDVVDVVATEAADDGDDGDGDGEVELGAVGALALGSGVGPTHDDVDGVSSEKNDALPPPPAARYLFVAPRRPDHSQPMYTEETHI